jgi:hypothetical protein
MPTKQSAKENQAALEQLKAARDPLVPWYRYRDACTGVMPS